MGSKKHKNCSENRVFSRVFGFERKRETYDDIAQY